MVKVYLAGPFFDQAGVENRRLEAVKAALAQNPSITGVFSPKDEDNASPVISKLPLMSPEWQQAVFANDLAGLHEADVLLVITDSASNSNGADDGTAFEAGYWLAQNLGQPASAHPIVLYAEKPAKLNLMLAQAGRYYTTTLAELAALDFAKIPARPYHGDVN